MAPRSPAIVAAVAALGAGGLSGCGSSSFGSTSTAHGRAPQPAVPVTRRLERALRRARATPPVSAASCRPETATQRSSSPFGSDGPAVYACTLARGGPEAAYDVQLLASGCFVAERRAPGAAIYGCGAGRT